MEGGLEFGCLAVCYICDFVVCFVDWVFLPWLLAERKRIIINIVIET